MHKSQQALLHAKSTLHEHKRRPRDEHDQDGATATSTTSASSPSVIKASSPLDVQHLRLLPMSSPTLTSSTTRRPPTSEGDTSIFAKCYQGIFAFGRTTSSPTSHEHAYNDFFKSKATTYERGRHFHFQKTLKEDGRAWEIPFGHGDELRGATSYGPPTP